MSIYRRAVFKIKNPWFVIGAAVVGIVSAASVIIAEHFREERKRRSMALELSRLDRQLNGLRGQLELLQKQQNGPKASKTSLKRLRNSSFVSTSNSEDYNSANDFDSSDLEFYDVSDDETSKASTITIYDTAIKDIDEKLDSSNVKDFEQALSSLEQLSLDYPDTPEILWRFGKVHYKLSMDQSDVPKKLELINRGIDYAKQALSIKDECGESHKWYAILVGSRCNYKPLREKIKDSADFKNHLDIAIRYKSDDPTLYHLIGRYMMEISGLRWYERKAVATLYQEVPECTYDGAIEMLLQAEKLGGKDFKENKLTLGKCYANLGNYKEAIKWLEEADAITLNPGDSIDTEVKTLLSKYNGYR